MKKYRCLLFDLDGTLVDSRADITNSVNYTLQELGEATLPDEKIHGFIGEGVRLLLERALNEIRQTPASEAELDAALAVYQRQYHAHLLDNTAMYPEVIETLEHFAHLPKAVVTNKPYDFTLPLLEGLNLSSHFNVVLGGDSLATRKPDPLMLETAAQRCEVALGDCLMIGDSWVDIAAGRNAGIVTVGYTNGFRGRAELITAGADYLIDRFSELKALVGG
jgi:phosphoglycolate phosphatase